MESTMVELNRKIDTLAEQVGYLTEQAQTAERQRWDRAELMRDLTPVANEAFRITVEQLEEVQEYIDLSDLLRLFKRLLRNGRNLEKMLDQLESLMDFIDTMSPLGNEAFGKLVDNLAEMEKKGYFRIARSGACVMDRIVASYDAQLEVPLDSSFGGLLRQMRDPEVRRGLALSMRVLGIIGAQAKCNGRELGN